MAKTVYTAATKIHGLEKPKDGEEHVVEKGGEVTLESDAKNVKELVAVGALVAKK